MKPIFHLETGNYRSSITSCFLSLSLLSSCGSGSSKVDLLNAPDHKAIDLVYFVDVINDEADSMYAAIRANEYDIEIKTSESWPVGRGVQSIQVSVDTDLADVFVPSIQLAQADGVKRCGETASRVSCLWINSDSYRNITFAAGTPVATLSANSSNTTARLSAAPAILCFVMDVGTPQATGFETIKKCFVK